VVLYSFVCHSAVLSVLNTLKSREARQRVNKVLFRTVIIQYCLYILIAVAGFLTAPKNEEELIVLRHNYFFDNDMFMIIGQLALVLIILLVIPVKYSILRLSCFNLCYGHSDFNNTQ